MKAASAQGRAERGIATSAAPATAIAGEQPDDEPRPVDVGGGEHERRTEHCFGRQQADTREVCRPVPDGKHGGREEEADEDEGLPQPDVVATGEPPVERGDVGARVVVSPVADHRPLPLLERLGRRRDIGNRDQPADARRPRGQDPVVAGADDRDRVAARVRVRAARRQRDVDRGRGRLRRHRDQRLAAGYAAEDRLLRLPADERREGALAADAVARAGDEEPVRAAAPGTRRRWGRSRPRPAGPRVQAPRPRRGRRVRGAPSSRA